MKLLDEPFDKYEFDEINRLLDGSRNRICISDDPLETIRMVGFACDRICMLAQSRILELYKGWGYNPDIKQ